MSTTKKLNSLPDGELHTVSVEKVEGDYQVSAGGSHWHARLCPAPGGGIWSILSPVGESFEATVQRQDGELLVQVGHRRFHFGVGDPLRDVPPTRGGSTRQEIRAPMPGKVVQVLVSPGEAVSAGQAVILFEAMKMQNELRSPQDGVIGEIAVETGRTVEAREVLYILEPH